jgi:hypothetical protein
MRERAEFTIRGRIAYVKAEQTQEPQRESLEVAGEGGAWLGLAQMRVAEYVAWYLLAALFRNDREGCRCTA